MPYSTRFSSLEVEAEGLHDKEGAPIASLDAKKLAIKAGANVLDVWVDKKGLNIDLQVGDQAVTVLVGSGGRELGEFSKGNPIDIEVTKKAGAKRRQVLKAEL